MMKIFNYAFVTWHFSMPNEASDNISCDYNTRLSVWQLLTFSDILEGLL